MSSEKMPSVMKKVTPMSSVLMWAIQRIQRAAAQQQRGIDSRLAPEQAGSREPCSRMPANPVSATHKREVH